MTDKNRVYIFDTTMRDGEQSPGASMSLEEKIQIARVFDELGVDIIEAGFPIASPGESSMERYRCYADGRHHWHDRSRSHHSDGTVDVRQPGIGGRDRSYPHVDRVLGCVGSIPSNG